MVLFPTRIRASAHGLSAAAGKVGGVVGVALFEYIKGSMGLGDLCDSPTLVFLFCPVSEHLSDCDFPAVCGFVRLPFFHVCFFDGMLNMNPVPPDAFPVIMALCSGCCLAGLVLTALTIPR